MDSSTALTLLGRYFINYSITAVALTGYILGYMYYPTHTIMIGVILLIASFMKLLKVQSLLQELAEEEEDDGGIQIYFIPEKDDKDEEDKDE